ncbi:MAG: SDR family oxidoreductase [Betaproteobacteria bacterium]|nr:SDR family oxidoreductase [Betaproteobacteria bacterium]
MNTTRFDGRVYLLSGAARGLGGAQARRIVAEGGSVLIGDVLHDQGAALAAELGARARFQPLDVTREGDWQAAVEQAQRMGPLHGLVNNAGVYAPVPLLAENGVEEFERHLRVNQTGVFLGLRAVTSALTACGRGSIVNISSTVGIRSAPNAIAYTATKWAVRGMTKAAALELVDRNIRVNSVHPGPIDTDMLSVRSEAQNQARINQVPMKRLGSAAEVAGLVCFLLSDESRYMTGSELAIDGGCAL